MRKAYFVITVLLLISVVIQFYFAALGVFGPQGEDDNLYLFHRINGSAVLPALSLLAVLFAALSRAGARTVLALRPPDPAHRRAVPDLHRRRSGGRRRRGHPDRRFGDHPRPPRRQRARDHGHDHHADDAARARAFGKDAVAGGTPTARLMSALSGAWLALALLQLVAWIGACVLGAGVGPLGRRLRSAAIAALAVAGLRRVARRARRRGRARRRRLGLGRREAARRGADRRPQLRRRRASFAVRDARPRAPRRAAPRRSCRHPDLGGDRRARRPGRTAAHRGGRDLAGRAGRRDRLDRRARRSRSSRLRAPASARRLDGRRRRSRGRAARPVHRLRAHRRDRSDRWTSSAGRRRMPRRATVSVADLRETDTRRPGAPLRPRGAPPDDHPARRLRLRRGDLRIGPRAGARRDRGRARRGHAHQPATSRTV